MQDAALETKVGFFLLFGLAVAATMIIVFGRFGESLAKMYTVTVEFPNANGLLKGGTVNFAGAPIGRVKNPPRQIKDGSAVEVDLSIQAEAKIRKDSQFRIVDVGMLGDRAIDIEPGFGDLTQKEFIKNGEYISGQRSAGLADLTSDAKPVMERLSEITGRLNNITKKIDTEVLTPETSIDFRESVKKLRSVLTRADDLLAQAQKGKGPLGKILNDPKMADDLASFIANIRRRGLLFYADSTAVEPGKSAKNSSNQK